MKYSFYTLFLTIIFIPNNLNAQEKTSYTFEIINKDNNERVTNVSLRINAINFRDSFYVNKKVSPNKESKLINLKYILIHGLYEYSFESDYYEPVTPEEKEGSFIVGDHINKNYKKLYVKPKKKPKLKRSLTISFADINNRNNNPSSPGLLFPDVYEAEKMPLYVDSTTKELETESLFEVGKTYKFEIDSKEYELATERNGNSITIDSFQNERVIYLKKKETTGSIQNTIYLDIRLRKPFKPKPLENVSITLDSDVISSEDFNGRKLKKITKENDFGIGETIKLLLSHPNLKSKNKHFKVKEKHLGNNAVPKVIKMIHPIGSGKDIIDYILLGAGASLISYGALYKYENSETYKQYQLNQTEINFRRAERERNRANNSLNVGIPVFGLGVAYFLGWDFILTNKEKESLKIEPYTLNNMGIGLSLKYNF